MDLGTPSYQQHVITLVQRIQNEIDQIRNRRQLRVIASQLGENLMLCVCTFSTLCSFAYLCSIKEQLCIMLTHTHALKTN